MWCAGVLIADYDACDMTNHTQKYFFTGLAYSEGSPVSVTFSKDIEFETRCIAWPAHEGLGSIGSLGFGIIAGAGGAIISAPQFTKFDGGASWTYGVDFGITTAYGDWKLGIE